MKILVAGATGVMGRQLVPRLVADGHEVAGMTRSEGRRGEIEALGARAIVADALVPEQLAAAVGGAEPEVIIHQLTSIGSIDPRHFDRSFAQTNRLRSEGTDHLLSAGRAVGVRRFIAQSFAGWPYARTGPMVCDETATLDPAPVAGMRVSHEAIRHLEAAVTGADWTEGIVLRYGLFYGPGTSLGAGGEQYEMARKRRLPVVASGQGRFSFVHIADAAAATAAAVSHGEPGLYNVVDDEPARIAEWLPAYARAIGAPSPWRIPMWLARLGGGETTAMMTGEMRGANNAKARSQLGWIPAHPSWRTGFAAGVGD